VAAARDDRYNTVCTTLSVQHCLYSSYKMQTGNVKDRELGELEADGKLWKYVRLKL
jgi:hypothetical protein